MEFVHSEIIDSSTYYDTDGLCGGIALRRHQDPDKEVAGALRVQEDWSKLVSPVANYNGGLGPYSFICVTVPECLPERLEIISYANEFAFLYDDIMEIMDTREDLQGSEFLAVFGDGALDQAIEGKARGEKKIQSQILQEMTAIDPERALTTMKAWATFVQLAASRNRNEPFDSLDEYVLFRVIDAGEMIWFGTVTFGMALTIPDHETELSIQLARPGYIALSLTNDLYSWEKECDAAAVQGVKEVVNAIWVIMRETKCEEAEAKEICKGQIRKHIKEFNMIVEATKVNPNISDDLKRYVEAVQYSHSGNLVWSMYCPRYHSDKN